MGGERRDVRHADCAEDNPVENVWQLLRDNWLPDRVFPSYDNLVDHCCEAWNRLVDQPGKIMSIGLRDWAPPVLMSGTWYKMAISFTYK